MVARQKERGQSLIEFVLILPVMVGMLFLMLRVSSGVQVSIVNQKYSRLRIFEFASNAPYYPSLARFRDSFVAQNSNRMVIGVSEEPLTGEGEPEAPSFKVNASRVVVGSSEIKSEPTQRSEVRVRNTVELCTPVRVAGGQEIQWGENSLQNLTVCGSGSS
jgi:hypothetical protein